ncbi:STE3-domain-containing protein [Macrolepiota fuliginosa MF-IS2]|uniref:STE3-domain-containing protein n=1 Tax=Macrolepiota fuliginosa MF-IS2 TaxID=1400762 RepID=A0A9P6BVV2_9AGAR|nr:STE3-domain-containing protein [Macrolepiota fuliginosa MF-IS2]
MADPTYPLFPILTFLGFFLVLIPLPWHMKAWNSGTCFYMMWAALGCLNQFINSIVWHDNALNPAPFWCEISIRIMMGASVGLPASSLCINRRLYHIITARTGSISNWEKKRAIIIDSLICIVFPLVYIALQYIVQGHRFNIYEDIGCFPATYNTVIAYLVSCMWPLLIGCISACYCILTLYTFSRRRIEFSRMLSAHPSITVWRYFRLMALAMTELLCTMPLSVFVIWLNATSAPIEQWISWEDTHFNYSRIDQFPASLWKRDSNLVLAMEFSRWVVPVAAFVFFAFFGFAEEARCHYSALLHKIGGFFVPTCILQSQLLPPLWSKGSPSILPLPVTSKVAEIAKLPVFGEKDKVSPTRNADFSSDLASSLSYCNSPSSDASSVRTCPW